MINYIEKGIGLHEAIAAAGLRLEERDGAWWADNEPAVQAIIDGYDQHAPAIAAKWEEIKAKRDFLLNNGGYKVNVGGVDKWFHSDTFSRSQQIGMVILGTNLPPIQWKTMDGTFVQMTPTLAQQIFGAAAASDATIFAAAEAHKTAMTASVEPWNYDFSIGWPVTYFG